MTSRQHPLLYQVNTRVWLHSLQQALGRHTTLDDIPDAALDHLRDLGFDWVWFLSVWQTGAAARQVSLADPGLRATCAALLPDLTDADICGSGFAVSSYTTNLALGGDAALKRLRQRLHARGMRLLLDFVPNHMAPDHPWVYQHPDYFVQGSHADAQREPQNYFWAPTRAGNQVFAHGRDPHFPGWPDTIQLNYANPAVQEAMQTELLRIAGLCDGVRCDMAMLILPEVFQRTWGLAVAGFWPTAIAGVRKAWPDFVFMAEVYWDLETTLLAQGFDYAYDKGLYDLLRAQTAGPVRDHLAVDAAQQARLVRFLENHDETRAASAFPPGVHEAAAIVTYLTPGLRFFHQGQLEGFQKHVSVHLCRGPQEPVEPAIQSFYAGLLNLMKHPTLRYGVWQRLTCAPPAGDDATWQQVLAWEWQDTDMQRLLVVVNYAPDAARCFLSLSPVSPSVQAWHVNSLWDSAGETQPAITLSAGGLALDLPSWGYCVLALHEVRSNPHP